MMKRRVDLRIVIGLLLVTLGFFLGTLGRRGGNSGDHVGGHSTEIGVEESASSKASTTWTCSMHPQIKLPNPGQCPICFMDLIPLEIDEGEDEGEATLTMSPAAMKLAEIQTTAVTRGYPKREVRMVGKISYDETRVKTIAAWVPGRLDRLYVDYTGISIRKGDHLVWMYSPELVSAQEELMQAIRTHDALKDSESGILKETAASTIQASREKLRLLGLTPKQVEDIESRGEVQDHLTIYAPSDGVVVAKHAKEGIYVQTGHPIYEIADLSQVWVKLDAYESDLEWIRYGQDVHFQTEAYPGRDFEGRIAFIDPILDSRTRTVKVRVNVDNREGLLKPEMFVRAVVEAEVAAGGRVMSAELSGKWICPMHPEVIENGPGSCEICEMPLVRAEDLGYRAVQRGEEAPLLIPATAPLITGKRAIVYVRDPDSDRPRFEGREVVLGPRAGDYYLVYSGLNEGELVVVNGAFKIDSAMQIRAKPSMMSPEGGAPPPGHDHGGSRKTPSSPSTGDSVPSHETHDTPEEFRGQLGAVYDRYLDFVEALANDNTGSAHDAAQAVTDELSSVDMSLLEHEAHLAWMEILGDLQAAAKAARDAKDLAAQREQLLPLSEQLARAIRTLGIDDSVTVLRFHCPMAFDGTGGDWLQSGMQTINPYYGEAMLRCGSKVEAIQDGEASR